jgi:hypothetical protein
MLEWFKGLFTNKINEVKEKQESEEVKLLKEIIERNTETMKSMDKTIKSLQQNLERTKQEVAITIQEERKRIELEVEKRKRQEEVRKRMEQISLSEKIVSTYLAKYLDRFNFSNGRFTLANNYHLLNNQDDLMFKIIQMLKLSKEGFQHIVLWGNHIIKFDIKYNGDIFYSIDGFENLSKDVVGIKFLRKFINDLRTDIFYIPSTLNCNIYEVKGRKFRYVLAKDEKTCYYVLKDKEMKTVIKKVDSFDETAYVKSIKSRLVYSNKID